MDNVDRKGLPANIKARQYALTCRFADQARKIGKDWRGSFGPFARDWSIQMGWMKTDRIKSPPDNSLWSFLKMLMPVARKQPWHKRSSRSIPNISSDVDKSFRCEVILHGTMRRYAQMSRGGFTRCKFTTCFYLTQERIELESGS